MTLHSGCLASPGRGKASIGDAATTPPKTPAKSPRCEKALVLAGGAQGSVLAAPIPYSVTQAVTSAVWAHAKAQAEKANAAAAAGAPAVAASGCPPMPAKRRRPGACGEFQGACDPQDQVGFPFPSFASSQPSQTQPDEDGAGSDDAMVQARVALNLALERLGGSETLVAAEVLARVRSMALAATSYWREVSLDLSKAAASLARFLEHQRRLYWHHEPWRGVNLGGWLLLEPGPSSSLFEEFGPEAQCEWDLMQRMREQLGVEGTQMALRAHRDAFITEDDIRRIKALGLNAVRIPFGYWVVTGPAAGDTYVGPGLEHLDRVLSWCKAHGLQALLDLHGAPGGESGEKPCGRERRDWRWQQWDFDGSLRALRTLAERYRGHPSVTGIAVCNEPSETVPASVLCRFYSQAVQAIREGGMMPDEVAVVLPVYRTERLDEIWRIWNRDYDGFALHANVAFDLHLYHCFGPWWQRQRLGNHLRMTKRHRKILRRVPAVVGEWSLALPRAAWDEDDDADEDAALSTFAAAQLEAYGQASHGWFFWNWRDSPKMHPGWDVNSCLKRRWLCKALLSGAGRPPQTSGGA